MSDLDRSIQEVRNAWIESPYYEAAEEWTELFWGEESRFLSVFKRLDVTHCAELACGHGRHSARLMALKGDQIMNLYCTDVVEQNILKSSQRLAIFSQVKCLLGNGKDFRPLEDASLTSIFCYDAMVHFSADIVESYLHDTYRVLKPGGQALFHHSNLCEPRTSTDGTWPYGDNPHARNHMTFPLFSSLVSQANLEIVSSSPLSWGNCPDLDRLSLLRKKV